MHGEKQIKLADPSPTCGVIFDSEFRQENLDDVDRLQHVVYSDRGDSVKFRHEDARFRIVHVTVN